MNRKPRNGRVSESPLSHDAVLCSRRFLEASSDSVAVRPPAETAAHREQLPARWSQSDASEVCAS